MDAHLVGHVLCVREADARGAFVIERIEIDTESIES
jgi:hypothetical protein